MTGGKCRGDLRTTNTGYVMAADEDRVLRLVRELQLVVVPGPVSADPSSIPVGAVPPVRSPGEGGTDCG